MLVLQIVLLAAPLESELRRYEENAIELKLQSGFRAEMRRHGVVLPFSFFAEQRFDVFKGSAQGLKEATRYRSLNVAGVTGIAGGVVFLAAALAVTFSSSSPWRLPVAYSFFTTSTAAFVGAAGALMVAPLFLSRAVAAYNEDMFD